MIRQVFVQIALITAFLWITLLVKYDFRWLMFSGFSLALLVGYTISFIKNRKVVRNAMYGGIYSLVGYNIIWIIKGIIGQSVSSETYIGIGIVSLGMISFFYLGRRIQNYPDQKVLKEHTPLKL